ncbi:Protein tyrosine/serine phosphatase Oca4 (Oca4) (PDB:1XRI) [Commensalibacter communis]|uniref:fused DSP-PTPase phosphatase/NAD kinase-like protein n=1 Tax=Commensalibacter communis TaxID=2972786 RepID=UPI0022FF6EC0|nr:tyrosine-protein phosphatase [Commensalibacter communis]CAI3938709.1 Protein tyrosine/serine phosphatase Oca4 (Oca4) (PDB:1XRI) [Commensalibacter communis]
MSKKISFDPSLSRPSDRYKAWIDSLFIDHSIFRLVWTNFHIVIHHKVYRCNHPTPGRLRKIVQKYQIKTIINLRGKRDCGSDALSRHAAKELGITLYDLPFESRGAPHKDRILNLAQLYPTFDFPILIHCKSGADRAGLVSALIKLFENHTLEDAMGELSWKFGHFKQAKTGILDQFFIYYFQQTKGKVDFLKWVQQEYHEDILRKEFRHKKLFSFITDKILHRE